MTTPSPMPLSRRKGHLLRGVIVFMVVVMGYLGWVAYDFHAARREARALGWVVDYSSASEVIHNHWKDAFESGTWLDGVKYITIPKGEQLEKNRDLVRRLKPQGVCVSDASGMRDLSVIEGVTSLTGIYVLYGTELTNVDAIKGLPALKNVCLNGCTGIRNLDALKDHPGLRTLYLKGCTGLTNVEGLQSLAALKEVSLKGCTRLSPESIDALQVALPNTQITIP
jgi:hypothetical protein